MFARGRWPGGSPEPTRPVNPNDPAQEPARSRPMEGCDDRSVGDEGGCGRGADFADVGSRSWPGPWAPASHARRRASPAAGCGSRAGAGRGPRHGHLPGPAAHRRARRVRPGPGPGERRPARLRDHRRRRNLPAPVDGRRGRSGLVPGGDRRPAGVVRRGRGLSRGSPPHSAGPTLRPRPRGPRRQGKRVRLRDRSART